MVSLSSCCRVVVLSSKVGWKSYKSWFKFLFVYRKVLLCVSLTSSYLAKSDENIFLFCFVFFSSNCPSFLAAALARATSDEVLQSDLSAHYLPKHVDNADGIIRKYICA